MGSLLKLPNELAFQIFDGLDNAALFALAKSCRHLNTIATSHCLSRHHILDPSLKIELRSEKALDALPFLRISTLLTSSQYICSHFTARNYLDEIRGLEGLIAKLSSVRTVELSLLFLRDFDNQEDEACFVKAIHGLLTTIISKSCETLFIDNGPSLMYSHYTHKQKNQPTRQSKLSHNFSSPFRQIFQISLATENISHIFSPDTLPVSKLTNLQICWRTLFDPSFHHWTIKLINTSPITNLSIGNAPPTHYCWDTVLSAIHSPTLSDICLVDTFQHLCCSSLAAFLARHQTISSLTCEGISPHDHDHHIIPLPRLASLASSCESVMHILEDTNAFPSLRDISLDAHGFTGIRPNPFNPSIVSGALERVRRCPNIFKLSLRFSHEDEALITWLDVDVNDNNRVERLLHHVDCLELLFVHFNTKMLLVLPKWLALFPALRFLTFQSAQRFPRNVARSAIHACSQLETLTINEESHTVSTWLAMEESC